MESTQDAYLQADSFRRDIATDMYLADILVRDYLLDPSPQNAPLHRQQLLEIRASLLISQINGRFGRPGWCPVNYLHRRGSQDELLALYCAADVALVTPLKDGMNLVAKEFCTARNDEKGVLVLSEFAGAAAELKSGALLVNPYHAEGVAWALRKALEMPGEDQQQRMREMRRIIQSSDVFKWCKSIYGCSGGAGARPQVAPLIQEPRSIAQAV